MKFEDFPYERPEMDQFSVRFRELLRQFAAAGSWKEQNRVFEQLNDMRVEFYSMYNICYVRHTIDIKDAFYEKENAFFDQAMPDYEALLNEYYRALLASPYRSALTAQWGEQVFTIAELSLKTFSPAVLEDLRQENRLSSAYIKLKAGARIELDGEEYNLSSIHKVETAPDRNRRRAAAEARWQFFTDHAAQIEDIFDQLVEVRHRIATKLGYTNFVELGYARMLRSDYGASEVAVFRRQVAEHVVPIATELYERQRRRLGLDQLLHYDENYRFASGNPEPKGDPRWIIEQAGRMYAELSDETRAFFEHMRDANLMDLETKPGKATGGYCTFIGKYKAPYIFSNFTGTSADIDVLTHEAGHAFQVYSSRNIGLNEYIWPTYEACEIHSMSMEFFTWPWMKLFFAEETEKYHFAHLAAAVCFLPYGVAVDEFQHYVYEHPEATPADRNHAWREIEHRYLPHRQYDGLDFLEKGGFWHKQSHIFTAPFYYIDYTLAQVCAFQFWQRDRNDHDQAWRDYLQLCRAGGSRSFLGLVELAGLNSPFADEAVAHSLTEVRNWLDTVDDSTY